jgi:hypothetical protein
MDGRSAGLLEEDETQVSNPKNPSFIPFFLSQQSLKTFQKCKKYKDRWAKPLNSVHIGGFWKVILDQISTMTV